MLKGRVTLMIAYWSHGFERDGEVTVVFPTPPQVAQNPNLSPNLSRY
jgi:hypothetical protein